MRPTFGQSLVQTALRQEPVDLGPWLWHKTNCRLCTCGCQLSKGMKSACIFGTESFATTDLRHFLHWKELLCQDIAKVASHPTGFGGWLARLPWFANSERLEVAACLGEEMASSMHNEETGGKFQCPIPSGWSFRLPFRAHLRFRLLRRSRGPRDPAIWRYKSQSPTDTNSKPPDRSQATRFDGGWQVAMLELRHCFSDRCLRCGARVRWNVSSGHINKTWPSLVLWLATSCQRVTKQLCIYCSKSGKWSHHKSAWNRYSCFGFTQACQSEHNHRVEKRVLLPCLCWRKPQATRKFHEVTKPSSCKHSVTTFQAKGRGFPSLLTACFITSCGEMIWPWHMTIHGRVNPCSRELDGKVADLRPKTKLDNCKFYADYAVWLEFVNLPFLSN